MEDLRDIPVNKHTRLAPFDIKNMYSNVPTDKLADVVQLMSLQQNVYHKIMEELIVLT